MSEDLEYETFSKRMHERFPLMFSKPYGGFAIGEGWWDIIESLCANIQSHIEWKNKDNEVVPQVVVQQIKEKFGGLRFYYSGGDDTISGMIRMAEAWASHSCETCGDKGTSRSGGWIRTLCDNHEEERQLIMNERKENV
jgi:hypothetical protein